jgi:hypothetical protein
MAIQKFVDGIYSNELLQIFKIFIERFFGDMICCYQKKSFTIFGKNNENARNFLDRNGLGEILRNYELSRKILRDMAVYNLDRKHCLTVLLNNFTFCSAVNQKI